MLARSSRVQTDAGDAVVGAPPFPLGGPAEEEAGDRGRAVGLPPVVVVVLLLRRAFRVPVAPRSTRGSLRAPFAHTCCLRRLLLLRRLLHAFAGEERGGRGEPPRAVRGAAGRREEDSAARSPGEMETVR